MTGMKYRAHSLSGHFQPAMPAAVAMRGFLANFAGLPAELPRLRWFIRAGEYPQRPGCLPRIGVHDLAWIENATRIEDCLQLAKHRIEGTVLAGHPLRAHQSGGMLGAHRASQIQGQRVYLVRN